MKKKRKSLLGVLGLLVAAGMVLGPMGGRSMAAKEAVGGPRYAVLVYNFNVQDSDLPERFRRRGDWDTRAFDRDSFNQTELMIHPWLYAKKIEIGVKDVGEDSFKDGYYLYFSARMLPIVLPRLPHNGWHLYQVVPHTNGGSSGVVTDYLVIVEKGGLGGKGR